MCLNRNRIISFELVQRKPSTIHERIGRPVSGRRGERKTYYWPLAVWFNFLLRKHLKKLLVWYSLLPFLALADRFNLIGVRTEKFCSTAIKWFIRQQAESYCYELFCVRNSRALYNLNSIKLFQSDLERSARAALSRMVSVCQVLLERSLKQMRANCYVNISCG